MNFYSFTYHGGLFKGGGRDHGGSGFLFKGGGREHGGSVNASVFDGSLFKSGSGAHDGSGVSRVFDVSLFKTFGGDHDGGGVSRVFGGSLFKSGGGDHDGSGVSRVFVGLWHLKENLLSINKGGLYRRHVGWSQGKRSCYYWNKGAYKGFGFLHLWDGCRYGHDGCPDRAAAGAYKGFGSLAGRYYRGRLWFGFLPVAFAVITVFFVCGFFKKILSFIEGIHFSIVYMYIVQLPGCSDVVTLLPYERYYCGRGGLLCVCRRFAAAVLPFFLSNFSRIYSNGRNACRNGRSAFATLCRIFKNNKLVHLLKGFKCLNNINFFSNKRRVCVDEPLVCVDEPLVCVDEPLVCVDEPLVCADERRTGRHEYRVFHHQHSKLSNITNNLAGPIRVSARGNGSPQAEPDVLMNNTSVYGILFAA
jgi:hypothetical protein